MAKDKDKDQTPPTSFKESVAKNDAYTGMLAISLIILVVGSGLLFLDWFRYSGSPPSPPRWQAVAPQPPAGGGGPAAKDAGAPKGGAAKGGGAAKKGT